MMTDSSHSSPVEGAADLCSFSVCVCVCVCVCVSNPCESLQLILEENCYMTNYKS